MNMSVFEATGERTFHCSHCPPCKADAKHQSLGRHLPALLDPRTGSGQGSGGPKTSTRMRSRGGDPGKWEAEKLGRVSGDE